MFHGYTIQTSFNLCLICQVKFLKNLQVCFCVDEVKKQIKIGPCQQNIMKEWMKDYHVGTSYTSLYHVVTKVTCGNENHIKSIKSWKTKKNKKYLYTK